MNKKILKNHLWKFPEYIEFEKVSEYVEKFKDSDPSSKFTFDLSKTIDMHSSFLGFLINVKDLTEKKRGNLELIISYASGKILGMNNLLDFFPKKMTSMTNKKSA
ncbi:hypothetical protein ACFL20_06675 [Spirochaetota bacterium]